MSNPSKKKGTGGETELLRLLVAEYAEGPFAGLHRTAASSLVDLHQDLREGDGGDDLNDTLQLLVTRPDRGRWLVTLPLEQFVELMHALFARTGTHQDMDIEVKRYARFALHTIFERKFGG